MDKIESVKKRVRHQEWRKMYESFLSSGQTVTEWCAENGVTKKTFYYRLRQIRKYKYIINIKSRQKFALSVPLAENLETENM